MNINLPRQWKRLLAVLQRRRDRKQLLQRALDAVVEGTDPRIRAVSGYSKRLYPAIKTSIAYIQRTVDQVPEPITLAPSRYASDPTVHACFSSVEDLRGFLADSRDLQSLMSDPAALHRPRAYAFLVARRQEKRVFGPALHNGRVRRDVAQTLVSFADRQLVAPGPSDYQARRALMRRAFLGLIASALNRLTTLQAAQDDQARRAAIERTRLQALQHRRAGLDDLISGADEDEREIAALQHSQAVDDAPPASPKLDTLEDYLDQVVQVFAHPERHLRAEPSSLHLTRMNRLLPAGTGSGETLYRVDLTDVTNSRSDNFSIIAVKVPRAELPDASLPDYLR